MPHARVVSSESWDDAAATHAASCVTGFAMRRNGMQEGVDETDKG